MSDKTRQNDRYVLEIGSNVVWVHDTLINRTVGNFGGEARLLAATSRLQELNVAASAPQLTPEEFLAELTEFGKRQRVAALLEAVLARHSELQSAERGSVVPQGTPGALEVLRGCSGKPLYGPGPY